MMVHSVFRAYAIGPYIKYFFMEKAPKPPKRGLTVWNYNKTLALPLGDVQSVVEVRGLGRLYFFYQN